MYDTSRVQKRSNNRLYLWVLSLHRKNMFPAREQAQTGAEPKADPYVDPVKELVDPKRRVLFYCRRGRERPIPPTTLSQL